jgi:hypothetical protein
VVFLISVVVFAAVIGIATYTSGATVRKLRKAKMYMIGELPEGQAGRVIGDAYPLGAKLRAPLTGRDCVYYIAKVDQHYNTGKTSGWKNIIKEERGVPFLLQDPTGRAIVDPTGAEIALDFDNRSTSGTFDDATQIEEDFLERHGKKSQGWVFNKGLRYREAVIHVGERVAVLGEGVREPDPDAPPADGYRGAAPTRLRLTSTPRFPLVISDSPDTTERNPIT